MHGERIPRSSGHITPVESDVPKIFPQELFRFLAPPGIALLGIENLRMVGDNTVLLDVVNRLPLPFLVTVAARFSQNNQEELFSEKKVEFIGPFGRDEWQIPVPSGVRSVDVRLGLFPFEVSLSRKTLEIGD